MNREVVFVEGARTPFGRMAGSLRDIFSSKLGSIAIRGLLEKTGMMEKGKIGSVILGTGFHCVKALTPARWATIDAGLGYEVSSSYTEMACGTAIDAINHAAWKIMCGMEDVIVAGGAESHSQMPVKFSMATPPYRMIPPMPVVPQVSPLPEDNIGMIETAENLQKMYHIPRNTADEFAYASQMRAKAADEAGYIKLDIVPVTFPATLKTPEIVIDLDEHPRPETTLEGLAKLKPVFPDGTVTAGNASGQNDGAAVVLLMSREFAETLGYKPLARWICSAEVGVDPKIMGIGPAYAIPKALKIAGLKLTDMDIMECNEAFAVQNLAVIAELEKQTGTAVDRGKWNPMGGAIAFGHANGASGARIAMFAIRELARRGGRYGLFSTCCGGGQGVVTIFENLCR
ncbi:MAG: thiolase family protein [Syntrophobacteraceae bacterium]|jgi:acetyl-CoA C-acetyltransferase